jgi:hypothetical protein
MPITSSHKKQYSSFRKFPITLYAIEFQNSIHQSENFYITPQDRTIVAFFPFYSKGFITDTSITTPLEVGYAHLKLEESDLINVNIRTSKSDEGGNPIPATNYTVSSTGTPVFNDEADIFLNLRTRKWSKIREIGSDRVTISLEVSMPGNELLDPFVILRKRAFIPFSVAHEDFRIAETSENISFDFKLDNFAGLWADKWYNTNNYEGCKITIFETDNSAIEAGSLGIADFQEYSFFVDAPMFNTQIMTLKLVDLLTFNQSQILRRIYSRNQCPWIFGRHDCGVSKDTFDSFNGVCDGSWGHCKSRSNTKNYGGFLNIPSTDIGGQF